MCSGDLSPYSLAINIMQLVTQVCFTDLAVHMFWQFNTPLAIYTSSGSLLHTTNNLAIHIMQLVTNVCSRNSPCNLAIHIMQLVVKVCF